MEYLTIQPTQPWRINDLKGQRFGRLLVLEFIGISVQRKYAVWKTLCDCGLISHVTSFSLRLGSTRSCGCFQVESRITHGLSDSPTYASWHSMIQRVTNPKSTQYYNYGGRGVTIWKQWLKFENFYADMGERPAGKSIDRYPNKLGNYEPSNCRWATSEEQNNNTRVNRTITYKGETKTYAEWSRKNGWPVYTVGNRIQVGWDATRALTTPLKKYKPRKSTWMNYISGTLP